MFRKKVKKAFTLVELLVVIAILAILATVSVVGYTQFTKRAQQSNDMSLTTQINTVLQADEVTGKPEYPTQAMAVMEEAGANIAELSPTTEGYSYVYNLKTNRVILLDGDKNVVAPEDTTISDADKAYCYAMVHSEEEKVEWVNAGYSVYLSSKFTGTTVEVDKAVGVDVGESNVTSVSITGTEANTATIYTNGGTLSVNAAKADVNFYGEAENVDVQAVKMGTFNVYGTISNTITLTKGKVAVKNDATVPTIKVADTAVATEVAIEADSTATLGAVIVPDDMVGSITVPQDTDVVSSDDVSNDFAGGVGTEASPYLIATEAQLFAVNDLGMNSRTAYNFKLIDNITITNDYTQASNDDYCVIEYFNGVFDGNGKSLTLKAHYTPDTTWNALINYSYGESVICNLNAYYEGIDVPGEKQTWMSLVSQTFGNITFENINIYNTQDTTLSILGNNFGLLAGKVLYNATVKNCNNYASIMSYASGGTGVWFGIFDANKYIVFDNVNNYANINGPSIGYFMGNHGNILFSGNIEGRPSTETISSYTLDEIKAHISVTACYNYGIITTVNGNQAHFIGYSSEFFSEAYREWEVELNRTFNKPGASFSKISHSEDFTAEVGSDMKIIVQKPENTAISYYTVVYNSMWQEVGDSSNHGSFNLSIALDGNDHYKAKFANVEGNDVSAYGTVIKEVSATESSNGFAYSICRDTDGQVYYVFHDLVIGSCENPTLEKSSVTITVYAYDANGQIIDYVRV